MVKDINSEQEGRYDILQNGAGEILIIIKYREGGPETPHLVMTAVRRLCFTAAARARLDAINMAARQPLKSVHKVLMVD